jgi:hypothetical protein
MARRLTTKEFIERAKKVHGDKYNYSKVEYKSSNTKVTIICPVHGEFQQRPADHLNGAGCPKCAKNSMKNKQSSSIEEFIKKAKKVHEDKYDYTKSIYINAKTPIIITCKTHGDFDQQPHVHLKGHGCPKCAIKNNSNARAQTTPEFIRKAKVKHKNKYLYNNTNYTRIMEPITITCKIHGDFTQIANAHLNGHGCPKCKPGGFNPQEPGILYYIFDPEANLYKIGITNRSVEERFGKAFCSKRAIAILEQTYYENGYEALEAESEILEAFSYARTINESWPEELGGRTEFFNCDILHKQNT